MTFPPSPESITTPPGDKNTAKSTLENSHGTSESAPLCQTILQKIRISSRIFNASLFAAHIPFVSADAGDDFSNNLFTDLAPVLALFGEQVVSPVRRLYNMIR